jgi:hypothetical protein
MQLFLFAITALLVSGVALFSQTTPMGAIHGFLVTDTDPGASGAVIYYRQVNRIDLDSPPVGGTVRPNAQGRFSIEKLPPGEYRICAYSEAGRYLDPCTWQGMPHVILGSGEQFHGKAIRLVEGTTLKFKVNTPAPLVGRINNVAMSSLIVGAMTSTGSFHAARVVEVNPKFTTLSLVVPKNERLKLWTFGRGVSIRERSEAYRNASGVLREIVTAGVPAESLAEIDVLVTTPAP